jgi:hypothetical protein
MAGQMPGHFFSQDIVLTKIIGRVFIQSTKGDV